MSESIDVSGLPLALRWLCRAKSWTVDDDVLRIDAGPHTDLFADPGGGPPITNAPALVGDATGDFLFSACVRAELEATFDAGALLLWAHERAWAKLALEYSPERRPAVVSVVTRGASDDCNSFAVDEPRIWLRVARIGPAFAFHTSGDGATWELIRHFALDHEGAPAVGFVVQSPTGDGCTAHFSEVRFEVRSLGDLRSGE